MFENPVPNELLISTIVAVLLLSALAVVLIKKKG
ncbi:Small hydrophobic protein [Campylobacter upsaliensis]|uniref:Small hydrophobic protein n=1 Tax=Campylobacter upsaliensis TaxID=28080 RepID=A0A381DTY9_CAMUP|nr:small hydrophobic protein [Campylobacter upsaliensis]SUX15958.1 small hydrophobic protein [Campylobacter upsaliensis]VEG84434.1 small hydrophobic protein [Campylobacter upsaliensis]